MTLAALILLAGVVGFFLVQQQEIRHDALQATADRTAAYLAEVSAGPGEIGTSISIGGDASLALPGLVAGEPYSLTFYPSYVVAGREGDRAFAVLSEPLHLWEPKAGMYIAEDVTALDALHPSVTIEQLGRVIASRRLITVDGNDSFAMFVFL